jgi:hypothetical protein
MLVVRLGFLGCPVWARQTIRADLERCYMRLLAPVAQPPPRCATAGWLSTLMRFYHQRREDTLNYLSHQNSGVGLQTAERDGDLPHLELDVILQLLTGG